MAYISFPGDKIKVKLGIVIFSYVLAIDVPVLSKSSDRTKTSTLLNWDANIFTFQAFLERESKRLVVFSFFLFSLARCNRDE